VSDISQLTLWPVAASANAAETDYIIIAFTILTLFLVAPIFVGITWFAFRYHQGRDVDRSNTENRSVAIELSWMIIPFVLTLIFFTWAAKLFDTNVNPPADTLQINAVAKQWMWKFQHSGGQSEINDLHVPLGQPVLIRMISEDVIHGLYLPALRAQMETLPGRYTQLWFKANLAGQYHLFCSEYCGTDHSKMDGTLYIMQPADYEAWLAHSGSPLTLAAAGKAMFSRYGCSGCHAGTGTVRAPSLAGLYGSPVPMQAGGTVIADDAYIRDKILLPDHNLIAGYKQVMPSFSGRLSEGDLLQLIAYIKSLGQSSEQSP
jgi:cytochrome c oxidase subunit 2